MRRLDRQLDRRAQRERPAHHLDINARNGAAVERAVRGFECLSKAGGIALGPTGLGHWAPHAFFAIFPNNPEQYHLLDGFGSVGMTVLLLLTGLETDLRLLRNLGRAALIASPTPTGPNRR